MWKTVPDWMSLPMVCGAVVLSVHLLIYGFLILTHAQIDLHHILLCISDMKKKREGTMRSG